MPPNIPTSFVPKQPVRTGTVRAPQFNLHGLFLLISIIMLVAAIAASAGVFVYGKYVTSQANEKAAELAAAQQNTSESTVEEFIRLRNRLANGETILNKHVTLSSFFSLLESLTLTRVRFTSLKLTVDDTQTGQLEAEGQAANFNALAAESHTFSANPHIKNAIFSDFVNDKSGAVSFKLTAIVLPDTIAAFAATVPAVASTTTAQPVVATTTPSIASTTATQAPVTKATTTPLKTASSTQP